jgi:uncharacterized protein YlxW (UPF0749 family)
VTRHDETVTEHRSNDGWERLRKAVLGRPSRGQLLTGLLCGALGFAAVTQVRLGQDDLLAQSSRSDLVQILDGLTQRQQALQDQIGDLEDSRQELTSSADQGETARQQAQQRSYELGVLAGTEEAAGPGVVVSVTDPGGGITSSVLLSAVQELRDAGAEAIEIAGSDGTQVRVVASTWFGDGQGGVRIEGKPLSPPYTITAIGDPGTLAPALGIPGGVVATVKEKGGAAKVTQEETVTVDALRDVREPRFASPAPNGRRP